jgi:CHASE2 domain-containing sensor protein
MSKNSRLAWLKPVLAIVTLVSAGGLAARQLGLLESWELSAYDQMMRLRPATDIDRRLLIVEITENDIHLQKQWPLPDRVLAQLLAKLEKYRPLAIGLDIYRDLPVEPGHQEFSQVLQNNENIIPVCKISDENSVGTPPPPEIDMGRVGFADIVVDPGGIVRRALLLLEPEDSSRCLARAALSLQLAGRYLETQNIAPEFAPSGDFQLGKTTFGRLPENAGSYHWVDNGGFQILLNYASSKAPAPTVTLEEVLTDRVQTELIKDKIVLIGVTASSIDDAFYTPYSASQRKSQKMAGVHLHAQIASQILKGALGERKLFWFWLDWQEALWLVGWSVAGALVAYFVRHPLYLPLAGVSLFVVLVGSSAAVFWQSGWIPLVPPALSSIISGVLVIGYRAYQEQQERQSFSLLVEEQKKDIALLQVLLLDRATDQKISQLSPIDRDDLATAIPPESTNRSIEEIEEIDETGEFDTEIVTQEQLWKTSFTHLLSGRYKISEVLGAGGFGCTYLAEDIQRPSRPQCVVKRLQPARHDRAFLEVARRLFRTEAEILDKLGSHPQIPQLLASFEEGEEFYLVEEYVPGELLSQELKADRRMAEAEVVAILKEMLPILAYIHNYGVIHRDIKPGNIIRSSEDDRLVLIDFGAVKQMTPENLEHQKQLTVAIGTKGYTPPEQFAGQPNFSSDLYALGTICIQALTGISPDQLSTDKKTGNLKWRRFVSADGKLVSIIDKMVRYHFRDRYQSANEILKDLDKL